VSAVLFRLTLPACAAALVFTAPSASAHAPFRVCNGAACTLAQAIDDAELAHVAGKFTIAGEVVGMSLQMNSSWQAANGQRLEAGATVSITLPNSGHAHAGFDARASASEAPSADVQSAASGQVESGSGLEGVRGVSQVIQVAGDDNSAVNQAAMRLSSDPLMSGAGNGLRSAAQSAANGAGARVDIGDNGVSLQLTLPGGSAAQQINAGGSGGIHQGIQIAAQGQQVMNQLQVQLQMRPATQAALTAHGLTTALNMLRGR